jgi:hypothetical protein
MKKLVAAGAAAVLLTACPGPRPSPVGPSGVKVATVPCRLSGNEMLVLVKVLVPATGLYFRINFYDHPVTPDISRVVQPDSNHQFALNGWAGRAQVQWNTEAAGDDPWQYADNGFLDGINAPLCA